MPVIRKRGNVVINDKVEEKPKPKASKPKKESVKSGEVKESETDTTIE